MLLCLKAGEPARLIMTPDSPKTDPNIQFGERERTSNGKWSKGRKEVRPNADKKYTVWKQRETNVHTLESYSDETRSGCKSGRLNVKSGISRGEGRERERERERESVSTQRRLG